MATVHILTACNYDDARKQRFLAELVTSLLRWLPDGTHVEHYISVHFPDGPSQVVLPGARELYTPHILIRETRLSQFSHLESIITEWFFEDEDILLFCDDDDYFTSHILLASKECPSVAGFQTIPLGRLYDGRPEDIREAEFFQGWEEEWDTAIDFSGYSAVGVLVKEYFASYDRPKVAATVEDVRFMKYLDKVSITPTVPFVMHRIWREVNPWRQNLLEEIQNLSLQIEARSEEIENLKETLNLGTNVREKV